MRGCCQGVPQNSGRQIMFDRRPRTLNPLTAVKRLLARHTFPPTIDSITMGSKQENVAAVSAAKARFKKIHEWHVNFAQGDGFNFHMHAGAECSSRHKM